MMGDDEGLLMVCLGNACPMPSDKKKIKHVTQTNYTKLGQPRLRTRQLDDSQHARQHQQVTKRVLARGVVASALYVHAMASESIKDITNILEDEEALRYEEEIR